MSNVEHERIVFEAVTRQASSEIQALSRQYRSATRGMSDDALRLAVAQDKLDKALSRHGAGSTQAKQAELAYRAEVRRTTEAIRQEGAAADATTRELGQLSRGAVAGSGVLRGFGRSVAFASGAFLGTAGLVYAIRSAVRTGLEFEREMRNVNSIARLSDEEFKQLTESVLSLAGPSAQAPKTLAEGLYELESSGFAAQDALTILEASSKAATAGLTDNATATKAVAAALNAYHLPAEQARRVSDILFATVDRGVLSFAELAQNMGDLVPAAAPLGVSLPEVGAALATITLQGVPAAEAATRVNRSLLLLAKPNKELTGLLKEQGFASVEAAVKARGYAGVLEIIDKQTQGNVAATAKLAPEIRSLLGVVGLTGKNLKTYSDNLRAIEQSQEGAGRTASVFAEQSKSTAFQLQRLGANVDTLEIAFSAALAPAINKAADGISSWLEKGDNMERVQRDISEAVEAGAKIVRGLAGALEHVASVAEPVVDALGGIEKAAELALILGIVLKVRRAATSFGLLQTASRTTSAQGVANATAFGRAWDIATRPRSMVVTTTTTGTPGPTTAPGPTQPRTNEPSTSPAPPRRLGLPGTRGSVGGGLAGIAAILGAGIAIQMLTTPPSLREQQRKVADMSRVDGRRAYLLAQQFSSAFGSSLSDLLENNPLLAKYGKPLPGSGAGAAGIVAPGESGRSAITNAPGTPPGGGGGATAGPGRGATGGGTGGGGRSQTDYRLDLARAGTDTGRLGVLRRHDTYLDRAIAALEAEKTLTAKQKQRLIQLYNERDQTDSEIQGFVDAREQKTQAARDAAEQKRVARIQRAAAKEKGTTDRLNAFAAKNVQEFERRLNQAKTGRELIAEQRAAASKTASATGAEKAATPADIAAAVRNAFEYFQSSERRYAGNFGSTDTRLFELVHETRRTNAIAAEGFSRTKFPASGYGIASAEAASG